MMHISVGPLLLILVLDRRLNDVHTLNVIHTLTFHPSLGPAHGANRLLGLVLRDPRTFPKVRLEI